MDIRSRVCHVAQTLRQAGYTRTFAPVQIRAAAIDYMRAIGVHTDTFESVLEGVLQEFRPFAAARRVA